MSRRTMKLFLGTAGATVISTSAMLAVAQDWLSRGSKDWAPAVVSRSGIGTANAVAEGRVARREIEGWCANWSPDDKGCVARELSNPDARKSYRASADCLSGRITPIDGNTYVFAGVWDNSDIGGGRTRWRDASGKIVGRDNASGGLAISQQWEVLCPGPLRFGRASSGPPASKPAQPGVAARFAVGEAVEARYGRDWERGRVASIRQSRNAQGTEVVYDVLLENGRRGVLPARMVRKAGG